MKSKDAYLSADETASFVLLVPVSNQMAANPPSPGTQVQLSWNGQRQRFLVNPDDPLQSLVDRAREFWHICDDVGLCLRRIVGNREPLGGLEQAFKDSGLGAQVSLCVDFADEASKKLHSERQRKEEAAALEKSQKEAAVAYQRNAAAHEQWRSTANPVELFRYDLKRHAQILEHVMNHANDEQLHRLFNTQGLLQVHNMVIGTFQVDPTEPHTEAVNQLAFQKFGQCPDRLPFCSKATRDKYMTRWQTAYLTGDVPKYTPPSGAFVSGKASSPPKEERLKAEPDAKKKAEEERLKAEAKAKKAEDERLKGEGEGDKKKADGAIGREGSEFTIEVFDFGVIIRPTKQSVRPEFPSVQRGNQIASFKSVDLKDGETQYSGCACEIVIAADEAGALVPQISFQKSSASKHIVDLRWLKKQSVASVASAPVEFVPISEALSPGPSSFSMLLKLDSCELRVQFGCDADYLLFGKAIRYLYGQLTAFAGKGQHLGGIVPQETIQKYLGAYGIQDSGAAAGGGPPQRPLLQQDSGAAAGGGLGVQGSGAAAGGGPPQRPLFGEGLVFCTEDRTGSVPEATAGPEQDEFRQAAKDLISLTEYNEFVQFRDKAMMKLQQEFKGLVATKANQMEIDQKSKEIADLAAQDLDSFNVAQELQRCVDWKNQDCNLRSPMYGHVAVKIDLLKQKLKQCTDRLNEKAKRMPILSSADRAAQTAEIIELQDALRRKGMSAIDIERAVINLQKTHEKQNWERVPFQYEDVLISVHFDGFEGAEDYVALCPFPKRCHISHVIAWLRHRVLDMDALVPACDSELPFTLNRLGLLDPYMTVGQVCSAPTSKVTCRVNLTESARSSRRLPFKVEPKGYKCIGSYVKPGAHSLFPKLKERDHEIERIKELEVKTDRKNHLVKFFRDDRPFTSADVANKPVLWKFSAPNSRVVEGGLTCDELRSYLNRGHFDDASEFGALLSSYTFSFDGSSYVCFGTHLEMLRHINHQVLTRSLNAAHLTLQATAAAAVRTWPDIYNDDNAALASDSKKIREGDNGEQGCLSFKLPLLPGKDPAVLKKIFTDKMASVDRDRESKSKSPLFCKEAISCNVKVASDSRHLDVEFLFSSFLSLDCIMRQTAGLQIVLESMMFDFYFEQTKKPEFTDLTEKWKCPICPTLHTCAFSLQKYWFYEARNAVSLHASKISSAGTPPTTGATAPTGPTGETGPARPSEQPDL